MIKQSTISQHRNKKGFSLVEVLVAFSILIVGITPLIALFTTASRNTRASHDMVRASMFATSIMADMQGNTDPPTLPLSDQKNSLYPDYLYDIRGQVGTNSTTITIDIKFNGPNGKIIYSLTGKILVGQE